MHKAMANNKMAKRATALRKKTAPSKHSHKTKKRLAIKKVMIAKKIAKKSK